MNSETKFIFSKSSLDGFQAHWSWVQDKHQRYLFSERVALSVSVGGEAERSGGGVAESVGRAESAILSAADGQSVGRSSTESSLTATGTSTATSSNWEASKATNASKASVQTTNASHLSENYV